jgi:hypothetical protein
LYRIFVGLLVLNQHLLVDDSRHSVRVRLNSDGRVQSDAFNVDIGRTDVTKTLFGWMAREGEKGRVGHDQELVSAR